MGLIQDLQGRKLTGCRKCDAVRMALYKGLDLYIPNHSIQTLASTHDSASASPLGAFLKGLDARSDCLVSVEDVSPDTFAEDDTVTITGTGFGASESNISLNSAQDKSGTNVAQTVDSWSNTNISITAVQGGLSEGTVYLFVDCQAVGTPVTLEAAGEDWFYIQIGYSGFGDLGANVVQHGDTTALFDAVPDHLELVGYDTLPNFSASTFNSATTFVTGNGACGNISTPDGHTGTTYTVASGSPDTDPGGPNIELRRDSDSFVLATFAGLSACDDDVVGGSGHKWGYTPA